MSATAEIARFVTRARYAEMPSQALRLARTGIIDSTGLAFAGRAYPAGALLARYVQSLAGEPQSAVFGHGFRAPAPHAAWANATLISALNWADSSFLGDVWHPSPVLWPAIFALAETGRRSGRDLLEAYVTGFEVGARVSCGWVGHYDRGWLGTATVGTLASACAAARLLDLNEQETRMAIGIACDFVSGTKQSMGAMHAQSAGKAARDGVVAASLARLGYTGDADGLDGPESISALVTGHDVDLEGLSADLGTEYYLTRPGGLLLKYYPSGHLSHWCIDATLQLVREHAIRPAEVEAVECAMPDWFVDTLRHHRPKTALEAKISVEYPLASAILFHKVDTSTMTDEKVQSTEAARLMARITTRRQPPRLGEREAGEFPNTVTIQLVDGRTVSRTVSYPKGDARNPVTDAELWEKFSECTATALSPARTRQAFDLLQGLDTEDEVSGLASVLMG
jgi:2-methylcitrate dehydratase PrpD